MTDLFDEHRALVDGAASWAAEGLGQFEVTGPDAHAWVNRIVTADISTLLPGHFVHSLLLRDDATILDRVTVYRFPDQIMLLVDAGFREAAWQYLVGRKRGNLRLRDISDDIGLVGVRGALAVTQLAPLLSPLPAVPSEVVSARLAGIGLFAARTTRDGPDGFDLYCRAADRAALDTALAAAGIMRVGNEAWRMLRIEWGIPTVNVEIDADDTPVEAGLDHLVAQGKGAPFPGESALAARRRSGAIKRLIGFRVRGDAVPPVGARVRVAGLMVDRVRSVVNSPRAGIIGMTAVPITADAPGTSLMIEAGDQHWTAEVVRRPFVGIA
jgi:aminomethyltransferase